MTIGDVIRNRRKELKMTQEDLAAAVGATKPTVSRWESGNIHKMKRSMIVAVCRVLQLDESVFFQREEILTKEEIAIVNAYRAADDGTRASVCKLLDIPDTKKDTASSAG